MTTTTPSTAAGADVYACRGVGRGHVLLCDMSMRAMPPDVTPCLPIRFIDTQTWLDSFFGREKCRCDRPEFDLCLSPLGVAIEVAFGSADHRVCSDMRRDSKYLDTCSPEIAAESLARFGRWAAFESLILTNTRAREHILSLPPVSLHAGHSDDISTTDRIEYAKHRACVAIAREEARAALADIRGLI